MTTPNDTKEKSEQGKKSLAGKLLSKFIREIANEEHDDPMIIGPGINDTRMITKAEALSRYMWKAALGFSEEVDEVIKGVMKKKTVVHKPDKTFIGMIWDRMEGRAAMIDAKTGSDKASVADKVSAQGKKRLDQIAKSSLKNS